MLIDLLTARLLYAGILRSGDPIADDATNRFMPSEVKKYLGEELIRRACTSEADSNVLMACCCAAVGATPEDKWLPG